MAKKAKKFKSVKKLGGGLKAAIVGLLLGIILTSIINYLVGIGWLPGYSQLVFSVISLILNLFTLTQMRSWGVFYSVGWLAGSLIFIGMMSTTDIILNIGAPILIFAIRLALWIGSYRSAVKR